LPYTPHPDVLQLHKFILSTNPKIKHPKRGLLCTSIYFSVHELTSLSYAIAPPLFMQGRSPPQEFILHKFTVSTHPTVQPPKRRVLCISFYSSFHVLTSLNYALAPLLFIQETSHPDDLPLHKFTPWTNPKVKHPKRRLLRASIYF